MGMDPKMWPTAKARPEDRVDPSEFWKDEPGRAEGYANIYVPKEEVFEVIDRYNQVLKPEILEWLIHTVGPRRAYGLDWYQNTQDYDWYIRGELTYRDKPAVQFCIRDPRAAMLFKLTYGGL